MNKIPNDIWDVSLWCVILSHLSDIDFSDIYFSETLIKCMDTTKLKTIMNMSLVNKTLNILITNNSFWVLYQNSEYIHASFNIYKSIQMFLKIELNIKTFTIKSLNDHSIYKNHTIEIITDNIPTSNVILKPDWFETSSDIICCRYIENEYCILCIGVDSLHENCNQTQYIYKKYLHNPTNTFSDKCKLIKFYNEFILSFKIRQYNDLLIDINEISPIIYGNYILCIVRIITKNGYKLNFCVQNIFTNIKYEIHRIEVSKSVPLNFMLSLKVINSTLSLFLISTRSA